MGEKMKQLFPSYANPDTWRNVTEDKTGKDVWKKIRLKILERDDYTCQYCGFKSDKWQIVHHIDGNPNNNIHSNLMAVCQMCNLIEHAGMGCVLQGVTDLYKKSKYSQNEIVAKTRELRASGKTDQEIIKALGLEEKLEFKQDWAYLRPLFGFVASRKAADEKTNIALAYQYKYAKNPENRKETIFQDFGRQHNLMSNTEIMPEPKFLPEQIEDLTLLLLYLQSWKEYNSLRAWKGYDFNVLNKLNEKGLVDDKHGNKSLYITEEGIERAKTIMAKIKIEK